MSYWRDENEMKRRWQTADALADWIIEKECNFFGTATFNEGKTSCVTATGAEERIRHFYNRQMRELLGARWHKHKRDQQAFCLATLEYGTGKGIKAIKGIHWHLHYKIGEELADKFNGIEHSKIWQRTNRLHRHFDLRHLETEDDLRNTAHYAVKQFWMRDEDSGYVLCGNGTN